MNLIHIMKLSLSSSGSDPRPLSLPPLTALRAFEAAARHESFRLAADELNITQSAVSHQIAHLEKWLGKDLFRRTGRKVELTDPGRLYFPYLREAFEKIEAGTQLISRPAQQELTVQLYVTVASRWMMGRLHALQQACPDLLVRFNASQMDWEFDPRHADVGIISTTEPNRSGFSYTPLFEARLIAVCSPKRLDPDGSIIEPADVMRHTLLQVYTAKHDWDVWLGAAGIAGVNEAATIRFDSYLLAIEAAIDGQGIAIVPDFLAWPDLASGRLVQPISAAVPQPARWYLVSRSDRTDEPAIARFRFWLLGEVANMQRR
jgi:LysR family glycine cleavage system transcriptional activator